jgi:hypothetical protein
MPVTTLPRGSCLMFDDVLPTLPAWKAPYLRQRFPRHAFPGPHFADGEPLKA